MATPVTYTKFSDVRDLTKPCYPIDAPTFMTQLGLGVGLPGMFACYGLGLTKPHKLDERILGFAVAGRPGLRLVVTLDATDTYRLSLLKTSRKGTVLLHQVAGIYFDGVAKAVADLVAK